MTTQWKIDSTSYAIHDGDKQNVIKKLHWSAVNGDSARCFGCVELGSPGNPFVAYEDVTEEVALSWLFDALGDEEKARIENLVLSKLNPEIISGTPWVNEEGDQDGTAN